MSDWKKLKVGDRIRFIAVPAADQQAFETGSRYLKPTIKIIQRIIDERAELNVWQIDKYGQPWIEYSFRTPKGRLEEHTLAVTDDDSWEYSGANGGAP